MDVTITSACLPFSRLTAFVMFVLPSDWYDSSATILPPSCVKRALNALTTSLKYTITVSVASEAVFQPFAHAYCAIADPSSWATLPNEKASLPLAPNRFGPIWSVPMHGAIVSLPALIDSCTTGAAKSTSHVVKITSTFWPRSFAAHDFAIAGLLPWVSHVTILSWRPLTPPFAFHCLTRIWAAASAGPSNGAIAPFESKAHPITIGLPAAGCGARNHGDNRGDHRDERCERPLLPQSHYALLGAFDGFTNL